jgi:hypothetical protein
MFTVAVAFNGGAVVHHCQQILLAKQIVPGM